MADTVSSKRKTMGWYVHIVKLYEQTYPKGTWAHGIVEKTWDQLSQAQKNEVNLDAKIWDYMTPSERIMVVLSKHSPETSLAFFSSDIDKV